MSHPVIFWIIVGWITYGCLATVGSIGQPREPLTPALAVLALVVQALVIWAIYVLAVG